MGKIPAPPPKAPSDSWVWDNSVGFREDGTPYLVESPEELNDRCASGCQYRRAPPSTYGKTIGRAIDAQGFQQENNGQDVIDTFADDLRQWRADQRASKAKAKSNNGKMVYMWNPSDDPKDPNGSIAVNYENHGALTKLFLKPTLPFNVTFSEW